VVLARDAGCAGDVDDLLVTLTVAWLMFAALLGCLAVLLLRDAR
jgi:hypothetical protein